MSRAVNINASREDVIAMCAKHNTPISAIESLVSGGTRVVLMNAADAATVIKVYKSKVLTGTVTRTNWSSRAL